MTTNASIGYDSSFSIGDTNSPIGYTELAEVVSITPPSDSIDIIDATHMKSPNATREFIIGLNDPGECSLEINFVAGGTTDTVLQAVRGARLPVPCLIEFPNGVHWEFTGIMTGYEPSIPLDDKMTATVTFKVTGSYTIGTPSP